MPRKQEVGKWSYSYVLAVLVSISQAADLGPVSVFLYVPSEVI